MKQEEKELLLKDLSSRLPYGVKICYIFNEEECVSTIEKIDTFGYIWDNYNGCYHVREIKPYLFPMSSMTKEQSKIYHELIGGMFGTSALINFEILEEFFNKNHIDYRGLIEKGLANDATTLNVY